MARSLYILIPYTLDERGKCCKSRVISLETGSVNKMIDWLRDKTPEAIVALGVVVLHYLWNGTQYELESAGTRLMGDYTHHLDPATVEKFENFDQTVQYYERLDIRGYPFPGDTPVLNDDDSSFYENRPREQRRHVSRRPSKATRRPRKPSFVEITPYVQHHHTWRVPRSLTRQHSPLFGGREMSLPPKGCHPFVKRRSASDLARKRLSERLLSSGFNNYELCDFGDVTRAQRAANFTAMKRRKGTVLGIYHLGRHPFQIVTDVKSGEAFLSLLSENT